MTETPSTPSAPPEPDVTVRPAPAVVYSSAQIFGASLVGTPIAGALLIGANLRALGRRGDKVALGIAVVVVSAVVAVDAWGAGPLTLLVTPLWAIGTWVAANLVSRPSPYDAGGGGRAAGRSAWGVVATVAGVWAAFALVGGGVLVWLHFAPPSPSEITGDAVLYSPMERVGYVDGARREDAQRVAQALAHAGYFTGSGALHLDVDRTVEGTLRVTTVAEPPVPSEQVEAARHMVRAIVRSLAPRECVMGRLISPAGDELAHGKTCP